MKDQLKIQDEGGMENIKILVKILDKKLSMSPVDGEISRFN